MGFVIQAVRRQGGGRPPYRAYSGRADNAARGRLGAKVAVGGLRDTAWLHGGSVPRARTGAATGWAKIP